jgi:16S rRNA (uracil1498-N3)-methyltransferase
VPHFFATRQGDRVQLTGHDAAHLARSLRGRPGQRISVIEPGDGREGRLLTVRLLSVSPREVVGLIEAERPHRPEPEARTTVALALLPAAALEDALARCTELGADSFLLIRARRSVARDLSDRKAQRWSSICREAAMLAGRLRVPEVEGPIGFDEVVAARQAVLLDQDAGQRLADLREPRDLTLLVGPEGGWTDEELALAGERRATLGPRNLRAEHAAAAALTVALAVRGDL